MVCIELTPLSSVSLRVRVVRLARPLEGVAHTHHDGHNFNRLDVEVVLRDTSTIYLCS